jgi:polar amino acid transport system substrate-binding protein
MTSSIPAAVLRDLAPNGILRAGINIGNPALAQRDVVGAEIRGVAVDLARELGRKLDVDVELVTYDAAGKLFDAVKANAWDVAFMAIDPERGIDVLFTPPYLTIEGTYLVRMDSPHWSVDDIDRAGMRVAIGAGSAYGLFLSRTLKHAELVQRPSAAEAFELLLEERLDAAAGVRQALMQFVQRHDGLRVIDDHFMVIEQAIATPKPRMTGSRFLSSFIEELKTRGFVAAALKRTREFAAV